MTTKSTSSFTRAFFITMFVGMGLIAAPTLIHAQGLSPFERLNQFVQNTQNRAQNQNDRNNDNNQGNKGNDNDRNSNYTNNGRDRDDNNKGGIKVEAAVTTTVRNIEVKSIATTSATISWKTNNETTTLIWYRKADEPNAQARSMASSSSEKKDNNYTKDHKTDLTGLEANTKYIFTVGGVERDGDTVTSSEGTFTTYATDSQNPQITSFTTSGITTTKTTLNLKTDEQTTAQVSYNIKGSSQVQMVQSSPFARNHTIPLVGLTTGTDYEAKVKVTNKDGKTFESTVLAWATVKDEADTTAPKISNVKLTNDSATSATITWTTDEPTTSVVWYRANEIARFFGLAMSDEKSQAETLELKTNHSVTITGLTEGKSYVYRVGGIDKANNLGQSEELTFTANGTVTPPTGDTTKPMIYNLAVTTNSNPRIAFVRWATNEPTTDTIQYSTSADFTADTTKTVTQGRSTTNHQVSIRNIEQNTFYYYKVTSTDAAGNQAVSGSGIFYLAR